MKGKWIAVRADLLKCEAYGTCSICKKQSKLRTVPSFLSLDVIGLNECPYCNNEMEFFYDSFY